MSSMTRKRFLEQLGFAGAGALTTGSGLFSSLLKDTVLKPISSIGLQLYSIIPLLQEDFEGTLKTLSKIGYKEVEFAGPYLFTPDADGKESGFYGNSPTQMRNLLDRYGLKAPSAHIGLDTLQNNFVEAVEAVQKVGVEYVVCPFLSADRRQTLDDYKSLADQFNEFGDMCKKAGLQFAYHNHSFEFGELEGKIPYNLLLDNTDPYLVNMELDIFWIKIAGYDPVDYFNEYPGRFPMVHVKDMKQKMVLDNPLTTFENQETAKKAFGDLEDVGKGVIDFKRILSAHKKAGVEHYFIERDRPPHPLQTVKNGYAYLSKLDID